MPSSYFYATVCMVVPTWFSSGIQVAHCVHGLPLFQYILIRSITILIFILPILLITCLRLPTSSFPLSPCISLPFSLYTTYPSCTLFSRYLIHLFYHSPITNIFLIPSLARMTYRHDHVDMCMFSLGTSPPTPTKCMRPFINGPPSSAASNQSEVSKLFLDMFGQFLAMLATSEFMLLTGQNLKINNVLSVGQAPERHIVISRIFS